MTVKKWIVLSSLVIAGLISIFYVMKATGWDKTVLFPVTRVVREGIAPLQEGIVQAREGTRDFFGYFSDNKKLRTENEELKKKVAELEGRVYALREKELENERLHNLLAYKEEKAENYELSLAKVIGRDPGNWYKKVVINRGSAQGIEKDMVVVTHEGLVGMVISTTSNTAEVLMIIDTESAVGAKIMEIRDTPGVISGNGKSDYMEMIHLPHNVAIENGQTIVTSGLGGLYPEGILVGTVISVEMEPNGLMKNARIKPFVDFNRLEEVFVILQVKKNEADMPLSEENTMQEAGLGVS